MLQVMIEPRGRALREALGFQPGDLAANRRGELSPRQATLLRAGRGAMRWSYAVFALTLLGSAAFVVFLPGGPAPAAGRGPTGGLVAVAAGVVLVVIAAGWALSRGAIRAAGERRPHVAHGRADVVLADPADAEGELRLGPAVLRLPAVPQLAAFEPGVEYRVYYLPAARPLVLSAEVVAAGPPAATPEAPAAAETRETVTQLQIIRRGRVVVGLIGLLALGIPALALLAGPAPAPWDRVLWWGLLALAVGFAVAAVRWLSPRR